MSIPVSNAAEVAYAVAMAMSAPEPAGPNLRDPAAPAPRRARRPARSGPTLSLVLRLDVGGRATLGPGKARLLELIGSTGSISAAARAMGMSYRRAWVLVENLNASFTAPLVAAHPGGTGGGGAELLPLGAEVVQLYRALEQGAGAAGAAELERLRAVLVLPGA